MSLSSSLFLSPPLLLLRLTPMWSFPGMLRFQKPWSSFRKPVNSFGPDRRITAASILASAGWICPSIYLSVWLPLLQQSASLCHEDRQTLVHPACGRHGCCLDASVPSLESPKTPDSSPDVRRRATLQFDGAAVAMCACVPA